MDVVMPFFLVKLESRIEYAKTHPKKHTPWKKRWEKSKAIEDVKESEPEPENSIGYLEL